MMENSRALLKLTIDTDIDRDTKYIRNVKYWRTGEIFIGLESTLEPMFGPLSSLAVQFSILSSQIRDLSIRARADLASPQQYLVGRNKMRKFCGCLRIMIVQTFTLSIRHAKLYRTELGIQI